MTSVFAKYQEKSYPHLYRATLHTTSPLVGGVPSDPNVAKRWLMTKFTDGDDVLRAMVAETMVERGVEEKDISLADATDEVVKKTSLNGFRRNPGEDMPTHDPEHPVGELFIGTYQVKAALKEACSIAVAANKLKKRGWGTTNKGVKSLVAEHIFVPGERIYLGRMEPDGVQQRFVHTFQGNGIQYEEYIQDAAITFEVTSDLELTEEEWAMVWTTGENQGVGATRSQGFGTYEVAEWTKIR